MAFPALRHALVAVALLLRVAAHDPSKCYEWGYPKEGKWQHDEDCCAGEEQAACAAGYRYHNTGIDCAKSSGENGCRSHEYTCTKCDGGCASDPVFVTRHWSGNYDDAVAYCASIGAEIATIYSATDNELARQACGGSPCWIGLEEVGGDASTPKASQTWRWMDGSTASYTNWLPSEPGNHNGRDERNVFIYDGMWYDTADYDQRRPLCRKAGSGSVCVPIYENIGAGCCRPHDGEISMGSGYANYESCKAACDADDRCLAFDYRSGHMCYKIVTSPTHVEIKATNNCNACYRRSGCAEDVRCGKVEACDTNYDIESEEGADYDCYTHFMICWFLWPVAYFFLGISIHRVKELINEGNASDAKEMWKRRKKAALILFVLCMTFMHWIARIWAGKLTDYWIGPCFVLGMIIPLACCVHGDRIVKAGRTAPAPAPRVELPARCARPAAAAPAGRTLRGLKIESVAQTEVTLAWEQGSAQSFEVQWRKTWGAWQNFATVRRSRARVSGLDAGGAYSFRVKAMGGEWSQGVSAQLSAATPAPPYWASSRSADPVHATLRNSAAQPERDSQPEPGIDAALGGAFNTSGRSNLPPRAEPAPERSSGTDDCPVCLDRARNTAFIPCGHQTCAECARRITSQSSYRCPVCRGPSSGTLRVF